MKLLNYIKKFHIKNILDTKALYFFVLSFIVFGIRKLFVLQMAYSDFYPFSNNFLVTWHRFFYVWDVNFLGSFTPKSISYIFRGIAEMFSFGNVLMAQVFYTTFFLLVGYTGLVIFLRRIGLKKYIYILVPVLYVFNPVTITEFANGITGILIIYSAIPWFFNSVDILLNRFNLKYGTIFSLAIAVFLLNLQTGFWLMLTGAIFILIKIFFYGIVWSNTKNILYMFIFFILGVVLNITFAVTVFNVSGNFSNMSYVADFTHNYEEITFSNLIRIIGNNGSPQKNLGYLDDKLQNILIYVVIVFVLYGIFFAKENKKQHRDKYFYMMIFLSIFLLWSGVLMLIKSGFFINLIEEKNLLLISIRNPQKIFYILAFVFVIIVALGLDNLFKSSYFLKNKKVAILFSFFIGVIFIFNNHYIINGDFGLSQTRGKGYFVDEVDKKAQEILLKNTSGANVLVLPFDYPLQLRFSWQKNVVMTPMGAKKISSDFTSDYIRELYKSVCRNDVKSFIYNANITNIKYILLYKHPITYKQYSDYDNCSLMGLYGTPYIWGKYSFFKEFFEKEKIVYEDNNLELVQLHPSNSFFSKISITKDIVSVGDDNYIDSYLISKIFKKTMHIATMLNQSPSGKISAIFSFKELNSSYFIDGAIQQKVERTDRDHLYINKGKKSLVLNMSDDSLNIKNMLREHLVVNGEQVKGLSRRMTWDDNNVGDIVYSTQLKEGSNYYIKNGSEVVRLRGDEMVLNENVPVEIYKSVGGNVINNPSFENGLWQKKVGDCNHYDDEEILKMAHSDNASDGQYSLELQAQKHIACTSQKDISVEGGEKYLLSFDYQSDNAHQGGFYIGFRGSEKAVSGKLPIANKEWRKYSRIITIPDNVEDISLYVYAYETDGEKNNIVRYDNFQLQKVSLIKKIEPEEKDDFVEVALPSDDKSEYTFEYRDSDYKYNNLIINPSFEDGLWSKKVGDCNNYDDKPILAMKVSDNASDGSKALQLEATRHIACTGPGATLVKGGVKYLLEFDYQSDNASRAGFYLGFNDEARSNISEKINIQKDNSDWHTFSKIITVPKGATTASLVVYSYAKDKKTNIITRYDNFKLIELPNIDNRYYLVSDSPVETAKPKSVDFDLINPTKKLVHIKGATKPFYLTMSESYHDKWQAQLNNDKVNGFFKSWVPFVKPDTVPNDKHFKYMTFLNGWYINPQDLCEPKDERQKSIKPGCVKNPDGSYDIEMVIEFTPQRWFYLGLLISGTTFVGLIGYLIYDWIRRKSAEKTKRIN